MKRIGLCFIILMLASACGHINQDSESPTQLQNNGERASKVSLSFAALGGVSKELQADLKHHFPTFNFTFISIKMNGLETYAMDATFPDLVMDIDHLATPAFVWKNVRQDLTDFIGSQGMDLSLFEPGLVEHANAYDNDGHLYELPYCRYLSALFYNKKAFDDMRVDYPKDGLTWDEVLDINKKFAGSGYVGFTPFGSDRSFFDLMDQFGLHLLDAGSDQSTVLSPKWHELATLFRELSAPGIRKQTLNTPGSVRFSFMEKGSVAMALGDGLDFLAQAAGQDRQLDLVSYPTLEKGSKAGPFLKTAALYIPSTSKHASEACQVIAYLLSEKRQAENAKNGIGPVIRSADIMQHFGSSVKGTSGKNIKAFFENGFQPSSGSSPYENIAIRIAVPQVKRLADPSTDLDDVLKRLDESVNKAVTDYKMNSE